MDVYCPEDRCPRTTHLPEAQYCGRCGTRLKDRETPMHRRKHQAERPRCPRCRRNRWMQPLERTEGWYCMACQRSFSPRQVSEAITTTRQKQKKHRAGWGGLGALLIVAFMIGSGSAVHRDKPRRPTRRAPVPFVVRYVRPDADVGAHDDEDKSLKPPQAIAAPGRAHPDANTREWSRPSRHRPSFPGLRQQPED